MRGLSGDGPGAEQYGAVVSVESLHHFTPEQKLELYKKIHAALRPGGFFLEADYIACCEEEETLLRAESARRRARANIPADVFIHFDTPLTLEHELALPGRGLSCCEAVDSIAEPRSCAAANKTGNRKALQKSKKAVSPVPVARGAQP